MNVCSKSSDSHKFSKERVWEFLERSNVDEVHANFSPHQQWNEQEGWKNTLNNLRLIIQPIILLGLIYPWLEIFPNRYLLLGFHQLIALMNQFYSYFPDG